MREAREEEQRISFPDTPLSRFSIVSIRENIYSVPGPSQPVFFTHKKPEKLYQRKNRSTIPKPFF